MTLLFFFSIFFIFFTYIGYPLFLFVISRLSRKYIFKKIEDNQPTVSVIIAARNEAITIKNRILNLLDQQYPTNKLQIVVISDGSTDETYTTIIEMKSKLAGEQAQIICHAYSPSQGKPTALNLGVDLSTGDILIFADARQLFSSDAVSQLVSNFSDPAVGGVSGELIFFNDGKSEIEAQMGAYWHYEKTVRKLESLSGSVVGATGAIYAIRRELYQPLPQATLLDDVLTPMNIILRGYRVIFDSQAHAYDTVSKDMDREWQRKLRTLTGNWQLLSLRRELLNPLKNRIFFRFFWHKLARLLVPFFLISLFLASIQLEGSLYDLLACVQLSVYCVAIFSFIFTDAQKIGLIKTICFFCCLNAVAIIAFFMWITGRSQTLWHKKHVSN